MWNHLWPSTLSSGGDYGVDEQMSSTLGEKSTPPVRRSRPGESVNFTDSYKPASVVVERLHNGPRTTNADVLDCPTVCTFEGT